MEEWGSRAERALGAGDEALARQALVRKGEIQTERAEAQRAADEQSRYVTELTQALKDLDARVQQVKLRKETLKTELRMQESRDQGGGTPEAFARFDRLSTDVDVKEAELVLIRRAARRLPPRSEEPGSRTQASRPRQRPRRRRPPSRPQSQTRKKITLSKQVCPPYSVVPNQQEV